MSPRFSQWFRSRRHLADQFIDSCSPSLPLWLAKWVVYVFLGLAFCGLASYFAYNVWFFKPLVVSPNTLSLTPASLQASDYQIYGSVQACSAHHPAKLCRHALTTVKAMTISKLPLYHDFDDCNTQWQFCFNLNTGPASGDSTGSPVVVSLPLVKGFAVAWDKDEVLSVVPAFMNNQGKLAIADLNN